MDIGDFLQFQGTFHSQAVVHGTADEEDVFFIFESTAKTFDEIDLVEDGLALIRQFGQISQDFFFPSYGQIPVQAAHVQGQEQERNQLRRIGLGRSDGDFRASPGISDLVGFTGNRRTDNVGDGQGTSATAFGFFQGCQGVDGFPGLTDDDAQGLAVRQGIAVTVFRSDVDFDGDAGQFFNEILGQKAGMVGRTAGSNQNLAD